MADRLNTTLATFRGAEAPMATYRDDMRRPWERIKLFTLRLETRFGTIE